ncbi:MAG: hypothetical protein IT273_10355 [Chitinophagales bacterium]|nr:hypothetical protein [Chitinophagales bacterium]
MDKYQLFDLLSADTTDSQTARQIAELLRDYPYFQTAHLLLARQLKSAAIASNVSISQAATHITNRETLYQIIQKSHSDTQQQQHIVVPEPNDLPDLSVAENNTPDDDLIDETDASDSSSPIMITEPTDGAHSTETTTDKEIDAWIEKSQAQLQEAVQQGEEEKPIGFLTETKTDSGVWNNTEQIAFKARQQVENELQQIANTATNNEAPTDTTDLTALLERESRELIQLDVQKDLEALAETTEIDPEPDTDDYLSDADAKADQLIQALRERVEGYKKEKGIENEPMPILSDTERDDLQTLIAEQQNTTPQQQETSDEEVIDLRNSPSIDPNDQQATSNTESILSETMARVYARQGYTEKARQIYTQLMTKYPEKSAYFAEKLEQLP